MLDRVKMQNIEKRVELYNEEMRAQMERYHEKRIIEGETERFIVDFGLFCDYITAYSEGDPNVPPEKVLWSFLESYEQWRAVAKKVKTTPLELFEWYQHIVKEDEDKLNRETEDRKATHPRHRI